VDAEFEIALSLRQRQGQSADAGQGYDHEARIVRPDPAEPLQIGNRNIRDGNSVQHSIRALKVLYHSLADQFSSMFWIDKPVADRDGRI
jgi:hypothetical protein